MTRVRVVGRRDRAMESLRRQARPLENHDGQEWGMPVVAAEPKAEPESIASTETAVPTRAAAAIRLRHEPAAIRRRQPATARLADGVARREMVTVAVIAGMALGVVVGWALGALYGRAPAGADTRDPQLQALEARVGAVETSLTADTAVDPVAYAQAVNIEPAYADDGSLSRLRITAPSEVGSPRDAVVRLTVLGSGETRYVVLPAAGSLGAKERWRGSVDDIPAPDADQQLLAEWLNAPHGVAMRLLAPAKPVEAEGGQR